MLGLSINHKKNWRKTAKGENGKSLDANEELTCFESQQRSKMLIWLEKNKKLKEYMNGALSFSAKWEEFGFGIVLMGQCVLMHDFVLYDERNSYGIDEFTMKIVSKNHLSPKV